MPSGNYKHHPNQGFQKNHKQFAGFQKGNGLGAINKGRKCSKATIEKMRQVNLGRKVSEQTKLKMTIAQRKRWSKVKRKTPRYRHIRDKRYLQWRSDVFQRDNWMCQTCGERSKAGNSVYLEAHHIRGWTKYPKLRYKVSNGITLCLKCHKLTDNYKNKKI